MWSSGSNVLNEDVSLWEDTSTSGRVPGLATSDSSDGDLPDMASHDVASPDFSNSGLSETVGQVTNLCWKRRPDVTVDQGAITETNPLEPETMGRSA